MNKELIKKNKKRKIRKRLKLMALVIAILLFLASMKICIRYHVSDSMLLDVTEYDKSQYPNNPAKLHDEYNIYSHKKLKLIKNDNGKFTINLLPTSKGSAKITISNIDLRLMTPSIPQWVRNDANLTRIALTDRQWNRQQVVFVNNVSIIGGDGFEKNNITKIELAKNCLNAGLWEIILSSNDKNIYHGWFTFPLGYYKSIFEANTNLPYWKHWYYLEHWVSPEGAYINLKKLRTVVNQYEINIKNYTNENIPLKGEQIDKFKNIISDKKINVFKDYYDNQISFSTFLKPGIYVKEKPWLNQYSRIKNPIKAIIKNIKTPDNNILQEIEIIYDVNNTTEHFYISGIDINNLPKTKPNNYNNGNLYLMGIATPPLKQNYVDLKNNPPHNSSFFSMQLSNDHKWINHHKVAIDGSILFRDEGNDKLLHIYLVSYERHAVVAHYTIDISHITNTSMRNNNL